MANDRLTQDQRAELQGAANRGEMSADAAMAKARLLEMNEKFNSAAARRLAIDNALRYAGNPNCKATDLLWLAQQFYEFVKTEKEGP
jgi:hypothetical protein